MGKFWKKSKIFEKRIKYYNQYLLKYFFIKTTNEWFVMSAKVLWMNDTLQVMKRMKIFHFFNCVNYSLTQMFLILLLCEWIDLWRVNCSIINTKTNNFSIQFKVSLFQQLVDNFSSRDVTSCHLSLSLFLSFFVSFFLSPWWNQINVPPPWHLKWSPLMFRTLIDS